MAAEIGTLKVYIDPEKTDWSEAENTLLNTLLSFAGQKIINRLYPYDDTQNAVPKRYELLKTMVAAELYAKLGAEGQTSHGENGISRAWESADVSRSLLSELTPYVGVL